MEYRWGTLIAALLFLTMLISAVPSDIRKDAQTQVLNGAAGVAQCRADFVSGYVNAIVAAYPNASALGSHGSKVESDAAQLHTLSTGGDADAYRSFLKGNFDADIQSAREEITKSKPWKGGDNTTLAGLKTTYQQLLGTYQGCQLGATQAYANARVAAFQEYINAYANQSNTLARGGNDISTVTTVLDGATPAVITPLQTAIASATNASQIQDAFDQFCLFDGCRNGTNYHLEAKYQVAREGVVLSTTMARINSNSSLSQYAGDFAQAQTDYASVQSTLTGVGSTPYSGNEQEQITQGLRIVNKDIQTALQNIRQSMMAARQAAMGNRTGFGNGSRGMMNGSRGGFNGTRPFPGRGMMNGTRPFPGRPNGSRTPPSNGAGTGSGDGSNGSNGG